MHESSARKMPIDPLTEVIHSFWQGVYAELGIEVDVPPMPFMTRTQARRLDQFRFMPVYLAPIEERYPDHFIAPNWSEYSESRRMRTPLAGTWVAMETIMKPNWEARQYPDDLLMRELKHSSRFKTSYDDLTGGMLGQIADVIGFQEEFVRLPSVEEWNLFGNLCRWLRHARDMNNLPDLGATRSHEWCNGNEQSDNCPIIGYASRGGLANVELSWGGDISASYAFRVLATL